MKGRFKPGLLHSMQLRFALVYVLVILIVLVILNIYPLMVAQDFIFKSKQDSLQGQTAVMSSALAGMETLSRPSVDLVMDQLDTSGLTRVMVTDSSGMVIYDSSAGGNATYQYALLKETSLALNSNSVFFCTYNENQFESCAAAPIVFRNNVIGSVIIYEEDSEQAALLQGVQNTLASLSVVVGVVVIIISIIFSIAMTSRIQTLVRGMGIVREGDYNHKVHMRGKDEMAQMADEFNQLTDRLQTTEEVRRRFVSDASHELKTPLASIRLLTDSILENDAIDMETTRDFVSDIREETDRLIRISEHLLTLTHLDANVETAGENTVNFENTILRVDHMLRPVAEASQVELHYRLQHNCMVKAEADDLYQIVFNLVENAIKYNKPGGDVDILLWKRSRDVVFQVDDSGVGIPEEDIDRIFDRFYRVDKARSREAGGTGLGLSIVRTMVEQYGGSVTATNNEPQGTSFQVVLPAADSDESENAEPEQNIPEE